jgi:hypothetical protein
MLLEKYERLLCFVQFLLFPRCGTYEQRVKEDDDSFCSKCSMETMNTEYARLRRVLKERVIILRGRYFAMSEKTMPVCFTPEQLKAVEEYAKKKGMLNASQAIEDLTK